MIEKRLGVLSLKVEFDNAEVQPLTLHCSGPSGSCSTWNIDFNIKEIFLPNIYKEYLTCGEIINHKSTSLHTIKKVIQMVKYWGDSGDLWTLEAWVLAHKKYFGERFWKIYEFLGKEMV